MQVPLLVMLTNPSWTLCSCLGCPLHLWVKQNDVLFFLPHPGECGLLRCGDYLLATPLQCFLCWGTGIQAQRECLVERNRDPGWGVAHRRSSQIIFPLLQRHLDHLCCQRLFAIQQLWKINSEWRPLVPLLKGCAEMWETHEELSSSMEAYFQPRWSDSSLCFQLSHSLSLINWNKQSEEKR